MIIAGFRFPVFSTLLTGFYWKRNVLHFELLVSKKLSVTKIWWLLQEKSFKQYCCWFRNPVNSPVEVGNWNPISLRQVLYIPGGFLVGFLPSNISETCDLRSEWEKKQLSKKVTPECLPRRLRRGFCFLRGFFGSFQTSLSVNCHDNG